MVPPTSASCAGAAGGWLRARVLRTPEMVTTPRVNRARLTFLRSLSIRVNAGESTPREYTLHHTDGRVSMKVATVRALAVVSIVAVSACSRPASDAQKPPPPSTPGAAANLADYHNGLTDS